MPPFNRIWIDCDPGHDDALALLLASYSPQVQILGVSIVHGNDQVEHCALNAIRFLWTCGVKGIPIYKGTSAPIVREPKYCPEIHGVPGEEGVSGMCGYHFPDQLIFNTKTTCYKIQDGHGVLKLVETLKMHADHGVTIVATGAQTNIALALRLFPEIKQKIKQIIFMGGAIGLGNTGVASEFNIEIDPEAAHIVLHSGIPLVMIPLEVTHTVLLTDYILDCIKNLNSLDLSNLENDPQFQSSCENVQTPKPHPHVEYKDIEDRIADVSSHKLSAATAAATATMNEEGKNLGYISCSSPFAECVYQLLTFFKSTYFDVFSFNSPPLHDPCTIFYLINPEGFESLDMFVDVELSGKCSGRTLCDIHGLMKQPPNVKVCTKINVQLFWKEMFRCLQIANLKSPLNDT